MTPPDEVDPTAAGVDPVYEAVAEFAAALVEGGVTHVVISPGSRSTPLTVGLHAQPAARSDDPIRQIRVLRPGGVRRVEFLLVEAAQRLQHVSSVDHVEAPEVVHVGTHGEMTLTDLLVDQGR